MAVDGGKPLEVVAELCCPIRVRSPCRRVQNEAKTPFARNCQVGFIVFRQLLPPLLVIDEWKGCKERQVDAALEQQRCLESSIRQEGSTLQLWQS